MQGQQSRAFQTTTPFLRFAAAALPGFASASSWPSWSPRLRRELSDLMIAAEVRELSMNSAPPAPVSTMKSPRRTKTSGMA